MPGKTGKEETLSLRWVLVPAVFFLDRLSKIWLLSHLKEGEGFPVIPGIFHITRVNNTGAAFGLFHSSPYFLIAVTALAAAAILVFLFKAGPRTSAGLCGWSIVLAGALGNLYDRLSLGYVADLIDLRIWPVFNIADTAICLGAGLILWSAFRAPRHP